MRVFTSDSPPFMVEYHKAISITLALGLLLGVGMTPIGQVTFKDALSYQSLVFIPVVSLFSMISYVKGREVIMHLSIIYSLALILSGFHWGLLAPAATCVTLCIPKVYRVLRLFFSNLGVLRLYDFCSHYYSSCNSLKDFKRKVIFKKDLTYKFTPVQEFIDLDKARAECIFAVWRLLRNAGYEHEDKVMHYSNDWRDFRGYSEINASRMGIVYFK